MSEQLDLTFRYDADLQRVSSRIASAIVDFCRARTTFHADELRQHVDTVAGPVAPGSADRILRDLRKRGLIAYRVVNRRASLYETEAVK